MKTIAVITGASKGIGKEFADRIAEYGKVDEVWAIARSADKLESLKESVPYPVRPIALDLSREESFREYASLLREEKPFIKLLINCSGFGKFGAVTDVPTSENLNMISLNCAALTAITQESLPYMGKGSDVIQIASVAAYQPIPYIGVYGATKAYVLSFSRALNREVKGKGIHVMAVCPFWTKTEFFNRAINKDDGKVIVKKYAAMYLPSQIVGKAYRDIKKKNKDVSMYGFVANAQTLATKILPHKLIMSFWQSQQKLK
ncbi:MAG: SDR family NAD(P)-dependent oxidoreductase [Clostridia bacterium]|nr:SDR family NAD(P)-dependent oxidoreductase [Clostridia bacterium]